MTSDPLDDRLAGRDRLRLFATMLERSPHGVFLWDREGACLYANAAACRSTGYPRERLLAMDLSELLADPAGAERLARLVDVADASDAIPSAAPTARRAGGRSTPSGSTTTPSSDSPPTSPRPAPCTMNSTASASAWRGPRRSRVSAGGRPTYPRTW
ncbi:MAG: PAS domain-containing protein [Candidatus Krumholzibacteriia bacterium]